MRVCFACGAKIANRNRVPFKELCPECEAYLHCCRNCRLYSPDVQNQCLSNTTEAVADRERANFCDEFHFKEIEDPNQREDKGSKGPKGAKPEPRRAPAKALSAREKFEQLFKD